MNGIRMTLTERFQAGAICRPFTVWLFSAISLDPQVCGQFYYQPMLEYIDRKALVGEEARLVDRRRVQMHTLR